MPIEVPGAVWSILAKGLFGPIKKCWDWIRELGPKRALLHKLCRDGEDCVIVLKWMYPVNQPRMGNYVSELPDFEAARRNQRFEHWLNIPFVIPKEDVLAAYDIIWLLGRLGKKNKIQFMSVRDAAEIGDKNFLCLGGHFKTTQIMNLLSEPLATWDGQIAPYGGFSFPGTGRNFPVVGNYDFGLILRITHPHTKKTCLAIMGGGVPGTAAAAYYFAQNASKLGLLFRKKDFALLVRVDVNQGAHSSGPVYCSQPPLRGKILGYFTWRKLRNCLA
jgi:hypothetical protein